MPAVLEREDGPEARMQEDRNRIAVYCDDILEWSRLPLKPEAVRAMADRLRALADGVRPR